MSNVLSVLKARIMPHQNPVPFQIMRRETFELPPKSETETKRTARRRSSWQVDPERRGDIQIKFDAEKSSMRQHGGNPRRT